MASKKSQALELIVDKCLTSAVKPEEHPTEYRRQAEFLHDEIKAVELRKADDPEAAKKLEKLQQFYADVIIHLGKRKSLNSARDLVLFTYTSSTKLEEQEKWTRILGNAFAGNDTMFVHELSTIIIGSVYTNLLDAIMATKAVGVVQSGARRTVGFTGRSAGKGLVTLVQETKSGEARPLPEAAIMGWCSFLGRLYLSGILEGMPARKAAIADRLDQAAAKESDRDDAVYEEILKRYRQDKEADQRTLETLADAVGFEEANRLPDLVEMLRNTELRNRLRFIITHPDQFPELLPRRGFIHQLRDKMKSAPATIQDAYHKVIAGEINALNTTLLLTYYMATRQYSAEEYVGGLVADLRTKTLKQNEIDAVNRVLSSMQNYMLNGVSALKLYTSFGNLHDYRIEVNARNSPGVSGYNDLGTVLESYNSRNTRLGIHFSAQDLAFLKYISTVAKVKISAEEFPVENPLRNLMALVDIPGYQRLRRRIKALDIKVREFASSHDTFVLARDAARHVDLAALAFDEIDLVSSSRKIVERLTGSFSISNPEFERFYKARIADIGAQLSHGVISIKDFYEGEIVSRRLVGVEMAADIQSPEEIETMLRSPRLCGLAEPAGTYTFKTKEGLFRAWLDRKDSFEIEQVEKPLGQRILERVCSYQTLEPSLVERLACVGERYHNGEISNIRFNKLKVASERSQRISGIRFADEKTIQELEKLCAAAEKLGLDESHKQQLAEVRKTAQGPVVTVTDGLYLTEIRFSLGPAHGAYFDYIPAYSVEQAHKAMERAGALVTLDPEKIESLVEKLTRIDAHYQYLSLLYPGPFGSLMQRNIAGVMKNILPGAQITQSGLNTVEGAIREIEAGMPVVEQGSDQELSLHIRLRRYDRATNKDTYLQSWRDHYRDMLANHLSGSPEFEAMLKNALQNITAGRRLASENDNYRTRLKYALAGLNMREFLKGTSQELSFSHSMRTKLGGQSELLHSMELKATELLTSYILQKDRRQQEKL